MVSLTLLFLGIGRSVDALKPSVCVPLMRSPSTCMDPWAGRLPPDAAPCSPSGSCSRRCRWARSQTTGARAGRLMLMGKTIGDGARVGRFLDNTISPYVINNAAAVKQRKES